MFFDRFKRLCSEKGVSVNKACLEMGLSRSLAAKWKATEAGIPTADTLSKISAYFNVPIDYLMDYAGQAAIDDNLWKLQKLEKEIEKNPEDNDLRVEYDFLFEATEDLQFANMLLNAKTAQPELSDTKKQIVEYINGLTDEEAEIAFTAIMSTIETIKAMRKK